MMDFDGEEVKKEFEESFDRPIDSLTERQLWWLVKIGKHIRGRCRNNQALMNYLNRNFKHANFTQVPVEGEEYQKTVIKIREAS